MMAVVYIVNTAIAFAAFALVGALAAQAYFGAGAALADGPAPGRAPVRTLIIIAAVLGGICGYRGIPAQTLAVIAAAVAVMIAIWYIDVTRGIIPDALTMVPVLALVIAGFLTNHWYVLLAALVPAIPFAIMAWRTKGLGMGWGDVKLAALGGALLGMQTALLAFGAAALASIVIARIRRREREPIAFAPYLASAIVLPLCLPKFL
jgi:leader peptidase (prepilin peptidase)/N-methyltransferase